MSGVTVITPSVPGRENLLLEAVRSVNAQTVPVAAHLIRCSRPDRPPYAHLSRQLNLLLTAVTTEWTVPLADDDLLLPNFVEALPDGALGDVFYSWPVESASPRVDCTEWTQEKLCATLERANFIPSTATIRTSALRAVGGWYGPSDIFEDWLLWRHLAEAGYRFRCVPVETWEYRFRGNWPRISRVGFA